MGSCSVCGSHSSTPRCLQPIAEFLLGCFWSLQMLWRSALGSGRGMRLPSVQVGTSGFTTYLPCPGRLGDMKPDPIGLGWDILAPALGSFLEPIPSRCPDPRVLRWLLAVC